MATFGRERRIRKRPDFLRVQSAGERVTTPHFVLLIRAQRAHGTARIGIVVTKRLGPAVLRNRVKRLCRECFRALPGFMADGIDLVVIPKSGASDLKVDEVRREWEKARPQLQKRAAAILSRRGTEGGSPAGKAPATTS